MRPRLLQIVHHGDDRAALLVPVCNQRQQSLDCRGIDRREGFVQQEYRGLLMR